MTLFPTFSKYWAVMINEATMTIPLAKPNTKKATPHMTGWFDISKDKKPTFGLSTHSLFAFLPGPLVFYLILLPFGSVTDFLSLLKWLKLIYGLRFSPLSGVTHNEPADQPMSGSRGWLAKSYDQQQWGGGSLNQDPPCTSLTDDLGVIVRPTLPVIY